MNELIRIADRLMKVNSWDSLASWYMSMHIGMQVAVGVCAFGVLCLAYIFIWGFFTDNDN